ncbi:LSU ribosomal protein L1p (L10Ae) [Desulfurella amilsii]|uniref:Large ribosomal subunit protein uL1 n=1 Tax=Desulfurella amilsii TaxID=1562698 RepID=A0A1X4XWX6_9BACT|nr:50S ribosomal protein L1 [Desulfurella amilsii]OSS42033.1 LSU ribosomal protein L1p (L10Ae) [Desulfurella amilsii]
MAKHGKKYTQALGKYDFSKEYDLENAISLLKNIAYANYDETVEIHTNLGIDPKHAEQQLRGTVSLPKGTGKTLRVLVFAKGEKIKEAQEAGADFVGSDDFIEKIQSGWMDFDKVIATPDMMGAVGKIGKILGPRGLMPNPKVGTVTFDIAGAVKRVKAGEVEFRSDKTGNVHLIAGKKSFNEQDLLENIKTIYDTILKAKPSTAKGKYIKSFYLSTTHSPSVKVKLQAI